MDEMFINKRGKTYIYTCTGNTKWVKIIYPEDQIRLSIILLSFYKLEKLISIQVSIPESHILIIERPNILRLLIKKIKLD
jgi:3-hydroxymyristoyl/3-hydroxydecanoyl-(acyl carrier protein) dehydratase